MLTILHPTLLPTIQQIPIGILPVFLKGGENPILVVKAPKEYILAAKLNASFKIYLAPIFIENHHTIGAISAFFDDEDEPLTITTPLFAEEFSATFIQVLCSQKIAVHFFDGVFSASQPVLLLMEVVQFRRPDSGRNCHLHGRSSKILRIVPGEPKVWCFAKG